ncbi:MULTISPECIES: alkaline phosphatase D family protein [Flavobacteriaceae]|uniref:alkaline phosphatase D family protein n=1 Tax=Flavobacteriaceae TaxID=49546 RepID=UPI00234AEE34|nr:alkaline phosphatase D family protein [Muricauda sp. SP22]MDC6362819.1 alkaline phosphatase D family protein [Muricauda sp. SP22]
MKYTLLIFSAITFFFGCKRNPNKADSTFVVAFGSCNMPQEPNPFWDDILNENPNVWIWGGDIVYADTDNMERLRAIYAMQDSVQGYVQLKSKAPIIGTWDDHDFGVNDGGEEFMVKSESQQVFLDFMGVSKNSPRRSREGVYAVHNYETAKGKVKILVLDTRYFRSALVKDTVSKKRYSPNLDTEATVLGAEQWKWLEDELRHSDADFNLILSSIQFLSGEHGFETWGNFPKEVEKLEKLIVDSKAKGVMILSGDRHISEFSRKSVSGLPYPLVDFTSSGLTHSYSSFSGEPNSFRVGEVVSRTSYGTITINLETKEIHFKMMGEEGTVLQELKQTY